MSNYTNVLEKALTEYGNVFGDHFTAVFGTERHVAIRLYPNAKKGCSVVRVQIYPDYETYAKAPVPMLGVPKNDAIAIWFDEDSIYIMKPNSPKFWTLEDAHKDLTKVVNSIWKAHAGA